MLNLSRAVDREETERPDTPSSGLLLCPRSGTWDKACAVLPVLNLRLGHYPQRGWRGLTLRHDDEPFDIVIDDSSDTERSTPCETSSDSETSIRSVRTDENDGVAA